MNHIVDHLFIRIKDVIIHVWAANEQIQNYEVQVLPRGRIITRQLHYKEKNINTFY